MHFLFNLFRYLPVTAFTLKRKERKSWHYKCPKVEYHEMHIQSVFKNVIRKAYGLSEPITLL
jgi:hypothetical protein